jgi:hypothetical protein
VSESESEIDSESESIVVAAVTRRRFRILVCVLCGAVPQEDDGDVVFMTRRRERMCGTADIREVGVVVVVDCGCGEEEEEEGTSNEVASELRSADDSTSSFRRIISFFKVRRSICRNSSTKGGTLCSLCSRSRKVRRRHEHDEDEDVDRSSPASRCVASGMITRNVHLTRSTCVFDSGAAADTMWVAMNSSMRVESDTQHVSSCVPNDNVSFSACDADVGTKPCDPVNSWDKLPSPRPFVDFA